MAYVWRIEMFGGLRATCNAQAVTRFRTEKTASLLAYLALNSGREHTRESLVELLWPEANEPSGRHNLRLALSSLRKQFGQPATGGDLVLGDRRAIQLDASRYVTDVQEFERALRAARTCSQDSERRTYLARAVELYSGSLLAGLYDPWIAPHQIRLEAACIEATIELVRHLERAGDVEAAAAAAHRGVNIDPLCEELQEVRLRLALHTHGKAAAGRIFREVEEIWRDLLGEPLPDAIALLGATLPRGEALLPKSRSQRHVPPSRGATGSRVAPLDGLSPGLFGRREELAALREMLAPARAAGPSRLVTLTGPGGVGKTRLSLAAADILREEYGGAVWFVSLADIRDADRLPSGLHAGMRLPAVKDVAPTEAVVRTLSERPSLIVLDNLEQLLPAARSTVEMLLESIPSLACLVTSRVEICVEGEREFPVMPLPVPAGREPPEMVQKVASVELFVERAKAAKPDFRPGAEDAARIADICRRLEGIPLAIELAAARCYALSPAAILARLGARYELLAGRDSALESRHRSLRAAVSWSCELLSSNARALFHSLSVFRGGFTPGAVAAICEGAGCEGAGCEAAVCEAAGCERCLEELRAASLITADGGRFMMLETLREFAELQCSRADRARLAGLHSAHFHRLTIDASSSLTGPLSAEWLTRLESDYENIRAAIDRAGADDPVVALDIAAALWRFWLMRSRLSEGRALLGRLAAAAPCAPSDIRAKALYGMGVLAAEQSDFAEAKQHFAARLAIAREMGDQAEQAATLNALGNVARESGDLPAARDYLTRALDIRRQTQDARSIASSLVNLANVLQDQDDFAAADPLCTEALTLMREAGDRAGEAAALAALGIGRRHLGQPAESLEMERESLEIYVSLGDRHGAACALHNMAAAAMTLDRTGEAREAVCDALSINRELRHRAWEAYNLDLLASIAVAEQEFESARTAAREALGIRLELGNAPEMASALDRCAAVEAAAANVRSAALLAGAADRIREGAGIEASGSAQEARESWMESLRDSASGALAQWIAVGRSSAIEEAIDKALG